MQFKQPFRFFTAERHKDFPLSCKKIKSLQNFYRSLFPSSVSSEHVESSSYKSAEKFSFTVRKFFSYYRRNFCHFFLQWPPRQVILCSLRALPKFSAGSQNTSSYFFLKVVFTRHLEFNSLNPQSFLPKHRNVFAQSSLKLVIFLRKLSFGHVISVLTTLSFFLQQSENVSLKIPK